MSIWYSEIQVLESTLPSKGLRCKDTWSAVLAVDINAELILYQLCNCVVKNKMMNNSMLCRGLADIAQCNQVSHEDLYWNDYKHLHCII